MRFLIAAALAGMLALAIADQPVAAQQNRIVDKKRCNPDACMKALRQKGYTYATAASWCATHNNGC